MTDDYRAGVDDVRKYLHRENFDTTGLSDSQIKGFIDDANLIVDEDLEGTGQSERRLTKLEAMITGAIMLDSDIDGIRQTRSESTDRQQTTHQTPNDLSGWRSNSLGRLAVRFDESGVLADADKPTASIGVPNTKGRY